MDGLRAAAPETRLAVVGMVPANFARQVTEGQIDLAFHPLEDAPPGLRARVLFAERYVLVGQHGHPRLKRRPTLAQFCELERVIVSPEGGGFHAATDKALSELSVARRVVLSVPHFTFVMSALANSSLVAMLPAHLVQNTRILRVVEAPVEVPGYEMIMLWQERAHRDPAHRWRREYIVRSV